MRRWPWRRRPRVSPRPAPSGPGRPWLFGQGRSIATHTGPPLTLFPPPLVTDGVFHFLAAPHNLPETERDFLFILVLGLAIHSLLFLATKENTGVRRVLRPAEAESEKTKLRRPPRCCGHAGRGSILPRRTLRAPQGPPRPGLAQDGKTAPWPVAVSPLSRLHSRHGQGRTRGVRQGQRPTSAA